MRLPDERTSGAWAGRCAINLDGRHEKPTLQARSYTATPINSGGRIETDRFFASFFGEPTSKTTGPINLKGRIKKIYIYRLSIDIQEKEGGGWYVRKREKDY